MRIAILNSYVYQEVKEVSGKDRIVYGGAERYLYELCKLLRDDRHEVAIYQSLPQGGKRGNFPQVIKDFMGFPVICLPDTEDGWAYSTNSKLNMTFNEIAKYYDLAIYFATFACWPHVVHPSISISHGIFWDFPQNMYKIMKEDERKEFLRQQLYGFSAPDVCVSVDSNVRKVLAAIEPGIESNIQIIYNFVDTERFKPAPKTWDGIRVLYPRRLTLLRGCNDFIQASQQHPEYEYIAVGQSNQESLDQQAAAWGKTTPHIRFIHKEMDGMEEVYQQSDIAVIPTRASEGLSLSLLEAMASGLPIITTPVGGLGDAIIDGYNALVYNPDHEKLGDYIHYLAQNPELRKKMGERNVEIAKCFDIKKWQNQWRELIGRLS